MTLTDLEKRLRAFALGLPETDEAFPWGERALRVRGKAFVFMRLDETGLSFSVKLSSSRAQALALPFVEPTHYGLGKHGWVTITVPRVSGALVDQFEEWIVESFRTVAPKRVAALLDAAPQPARASRRKRRKASDKA